MGVVVKAIDGKMRLMFDGRYVKLFALYQGFKYEKLSNVRCRWAPRDTNPMVFADNNSKVPDPSHWGITTPNIYYEVLTALKVDPLDITLNSFGDEIFH
eukprot:jgi/Tetstr1/462538/TSEL_007527.t1